MINANDARNMTAAAKKKLDDEQSPRIDRIMTNLAEMITRKAGAGERELSICRSIFIQAADANVVHQRLAQDGYNVVRKATGDYWISW